MRRDSQPPAPSLIERRIFPVAARRAEHDGDDGDYTVEFSAASSRPIWRGWLEDDYLEVIKLRAGHIKWLKSGNAPALWMHDARDPVGRVIKAWLKKDDDGHQVLHVKVQFYKDDDESMRCYKRVRDGMICNVSIGWSTKKGGYRWDKVEADGYDDEVDQLTFTDIDVKEVSFVSTPADETVGIGRGDQYVPQAEIMRTREGIMKVKRTDDDGNTQEVELESMTRSDLLDYAVEQFGQDWIDARRGLRKAALVTAIEEGLTDEGDPDDVEEIDLEDATRGELLEFAEDEFGSEWARAHKRTRKADLLAAIEAELDDEPEPDDDTGTRYDPTGMRWLNDNEDKLKRMGLTTKQIRSLRKFADDRKETGVSKERMQAQAFGYMDDADQAGNGRAAPQVMKRGEHAFSCQRAVRQLGLNQNGRDGIDGLEREVLDEFDAAYYADDARQWAPERGGNSIMIPHSAMMADPDCRGVVLQGVSADMRKRAEQYFGERAYAVGGTPAGFHHEVFDETFFVEALIAKAKLLSKCTILSGELMQDLVGVVESGEITVLHQTETGSIAESAGLSFGNRTFQWHNIVARKDVSRRTLDQSRMFFPRLLQVMQRDTVRGQNRALINGNPANNQPTGIVRYAAIPTVAIHTNGGNPTYDTMVDMYTTVKANQAMYGRSCFALTTEIEGRLQKTKRFTSSQGDAGDAIISGAPNSQMRNIDGYELVTDDNLPKNLTKGTGTNLHAMIFGDFADIELGMFSGMEVMTDPYSAMETSQIRTYVRQAYDILPRHVNSFVVCLDAKK